MCGYIVMGMLFYHVTKNLGYAKELMRVGVDLGRNTDKMGGGFYLWSTLDAAKKYVNDEEFVDRGGNDPYIMVFDIEPSVDIFDIDYEIHAINFAKYAVENAEKIAKITGTEVRFTNYPDYWDGKFPTWWKKGVFQFKGPDAESGVSSSDSEKFYNVIKKYPELESDYENYLFQKAKENKRVALKYIGPSIKPVKVLDREGLPVDIDMINERMLRLCGII